MIIFKVLFAIALGFGRLHGQSSAHPTASCDVSTHSFDVVSSATVNYANAKAAGIGLDQVVIADNSNGGITGSYGRPRDIIFDNTIPAWELNEQYLNGTFEISSAAVNGTARIAAIKGIFLVTYVKLTPDGDSDLSDDVTVMSRTVDTSSFASVGVETVVVVLNPEYDFLAAGRSGFFYSSVVGSTMNILKSMSGSSWVPLDASSISDAVSMPLAATVDVAGNYLLVYHTSSTQLGFAFSALGTAELQVKGAPLATGGNVAVAVNSTSVYMVLANNAGSLTYSISEDSGVSWASAQSMINPSLVATNSNVGLIKTTSRWVAVVLAQNERDILSYSTKATFPAPSDWLNFTQIKGSGPLSYRNPYFQATGGEGYAIATTDTLSNDVYVRPCYDTPLNTTKPPTSGAVSLRKAFLASLLIEASVLFMLM